MVSILFLSVIEYHSIRTIDKASPTRCRLWRWIALTGSTLRSFLLLLVHISCSISPLRQPIGLAGLGSCLLLISVPLLDVVVAIENHGATAAQPGA